MRLKKCILYGETFFLLIGRGVLSVEGYRMVHGKHWWGGLKDEHGSLVETVSGP